MSLVVRKPKAILFDVICTVTKSSWLEKVVYPFLWRNAAAYLSRNWGNRVLARDVELLRLQAAKEGREFTVSRDQQSKATEASIAAVAAYVQHCLETMVNHEAIRNFRFVQQKPKQNSYFNPPTFLAFLPSPFYSFHMLFFGLEHGKLETAVYSDAAICLADWATKESIMLHVVSSGWAEAMRRLLARTNHSDLSLIIRSFVDTELGPMEEAATYRAVLKRLGLGAEETLFLTHSARKAVAAHQAGLNVVMVATHREDEARERSFSPVVQSAGMPFIRIFTDLTFSVDAPLASTLVDREAMNRAINRSVQLQPQVTAVSTSVVSKSKSSPREKSCSSKKTRKMMMEKTSSRSSRKKNILKVVASHSKSRSGPGVCGKSSSSSPGAPSSKSQPASSGSSNLPPPPAISKSSTSPTKGSGPGLIVNSKVSPGASKSSASAVPPSTSGKSTSKSSSKKH